VSRVGTGDQMLECYLAELAIDAIEGGVVRALDQGADLRGDRGVERDHPAGWSGERGRRCWLGLDRCWSLLLRARGGEGGWIRPGRTEPWRSEMRANESKSTSRAPAWFSGCVPSPAERGNGILTSPGLRKHTEIRNTPPFQNTCLLQL
jgi:hypothetical protein